MERKLKSSETRVSERAWIAAHGLSSNPQCMSCRDNQFASDASDEYIHCSGPALWHPQGSSAVLGTRPKSGNPLMTTLNLTHHCWNEAFGGSVVHFLWIDRGARSPPMPVAMQIAGLFSCTPSACATSTSCTLSGGWSLLVGAPLTPCSLPGQDIIPQPGIHRGVQEPMSASRLPCHVGILPAQTAGTL